MSPVLLPAAEAQAQAEAQAAEAEAEAEAAAAEAAAAAEEAAAAATAAAAAAAEAAVPDVAVRRPSYVWAQNRSFVFITASVPRASARTPPVVTFAAGGAELVVAAELGQVAIRLHLELLRRISPTESSWEATNRGPLLRLKKLRPAHWARLLAEDGHDARQGTDWSRWHHPEVDRAARRDAARDEFARRGPRVGSGATAHGDKRAAAPQPPYHA